MLRAGLNHQCTVESPQHVFDLNVERRHLLKIICYHIYAIHILVKYKENSLMYRAQDCSIGSNVNFKDPPITAAIFKARLSSITHCKSNEHNVIYT